ncbi:hypothetical protein BJ508DRAFT_339070 [Ascobolus immersus RN42]|uniref:Uncharacterized protein n=1 Tax=Ascobolus immersus RN42 TaxID=1160509 RepID=A0A3N4I0B7_ASCIM|nr:hypothetical protein BJ508DRAFT_339070 [Ascobolus immersus RN42]
MSNSKPTFTSTLLASVKKKIESLFRKAPPPREKVNESPPSREEINDSPPSREEVNDILNKKLRVAIDTLEKATSQKFPLYLEGSKRCQDDSDDQAREKAYKDIQRATIDEWNKWADDSEFLGFDGVQQEKYADDNKTFLVDQVYPNIRDKILKPLMSWNPKYVETVQEDIRAYDRQELAPESPYPYLAPEWKATLLCVNEVLDFYAFVLNARIVGMTAVVAELVGKAAKDPEWGGLVHFRASQLFKRRPGA